MDKSVILELVTGRVEPKIYAFLTSDVPRFLKVGDTYRPVRERIKEWKDKGFAIEDDAYTDWEASIEPGVYFRDYEVHKYLTGVAGMEQISRAKLEKLPRNTESKHGASRPYSQEFYRYTAEGNPESNDVKAASVNVGLAIKDIHAYHSGGKEHKLSYRIFDVRGKVEESKKERITKNPRDNQKDAIKKFWAAVGGHPKRGTKLLMYAVMRFGKTFTSLCCAKKMNAKLVVVVSAKADVADEWRGEVEETANFSNYEFLDASALKRNDSILDQIREKKKSFVLFLTLQSFLKKKEWLSGLFEKKIDLLIVDETHFGARAEKLGRIIAEKKKSAADKKVEDDVDRDDDVEEGSGREAETEVVRQMTLHSTVTLHLSGTPYRILMRGEFPDDKIVAFCQYTDIIAAQKSWDRDHLGKQKPASGNGEEYSEWENPYYGFPEMVRFAFSPSPQALKLIECAREMGETCSFSEIFRPEVDRDNNFTGRFVHQKEVEEFLRIFNGSTEGEKVGFPSLLKFLHDNKRDICRHIVMVLPYCASCDAMAALLKSGTFPNLAKYEVLNISGHTRPDVFNDPKEVKSRIKKLADADKCTLTLTVNRMLTGSTVPEWDTMIFLKETKSPQEYDQAIFRLQSPYTQLIPSVHEDGSQVFIKRNLKPQTLLIDFNPSRMFQMQELKGRIYIENKGKKGKRELEKRIQVELDVSPIIFANGDKLKVADKTDVVNEVRKYSGTRGISEEVLEMAVDLDVLGESKRLRMAIENENMLDAKSGIRIGASDGDEDDFDPLAKRPQKPVEKTAEEKKAEKDDPKKALASQFRSYYRRILFFVFLIDDRVDNLDDVVEAIAPANERNIRIAQHLRLNRYSIGDLKLMRPQVLHQFEYGISKISELAHDKNKKDPVDRALVAIRKFGRLGESEIVTPQHVAKAMVQMIPDDEWKRMVNNGEKILDIAAKTGEFAVAIVRKLREIGIAEKDYKKALLAIPTSAISYEFTRKVYELLGLDARKCIASPDKPERMTSYNLLTIKKNPTSKTPDYEQIKALLTQKKDFNKISINDKISKKGKAMCLKVGAVISNPPYQIDDGGNGRSASAIYPKFVGMGKTTALSFVSMIMPAKWYSGGKGVDDFRDEMLKDSRIANLVDFADSHQCFGDAADVAGGVCYFLIDKNHKGDCKCINFDSHGNRVESNRNLGERSLFVRHPVANAIIQKVEAFHERRMNEMVSARKPFGLATNAKPFSKGDIGLRTNSGMAKYLRSRVKVGADLIDKWNVMMSYLSAEHAGQPDKKGMYKVLSSLDILPPGNICTETYILAGSFDTKAEAENLLNYLKTHFVRFLVGQVAMTQHITRNSFCFVPVQDFSVKWSDEDLYSKYRISEGEKNFIESIIKEM